MKEKRNNKKAVKGDLLKGKKKVAKLMSVNEWDQLIQFDLFVDIDDVFED